MRYAVVERGRRSAGVAFAIFNDGLCQATARDAVRNITPQNLRIADLECQRRKSKTNMQ
jgi:hypothetical protein